jgi:hypothetical protein
MIYDPTNPPEKTFDFIIRANVHVKAGARRFAEFGVDDMGVGSRVLLVIERASRAIIAWRPIV